MHIGVNLGFGNLHENLTDEQMYQGELSLAELSDRLGFDSLWSVEHHFDDYARRRGRTATSASSSRPTSGTTSWPATTSGAPKGTNATRSRRRPCGKQAWRTRRPDSRRAR